VVTRLQKRDAVPLDEIDEAMLLREAPRPDTPAEMLQRLRLADSVERISHDGLDEIHETQRDAPLGFDPVAEIFSKLRLEDGRPDRRHRLSGAGFEP